ncbi:B-cell CLL/lymphoma 9 protein [Rhizoctonia solani]|uniref:B-cell CLL/lymphoma 9 protein n=1 Tax=Rhizoctonia solani TaxID=456999 RepID=A0A0K6FYS4_9AGAM|nr:B-cell CLL/lymphoma 9 protein [Rhizoctonia solani]
MGPSRRGFDKQRSPTPEPCPRPLTPTTPPQIRSAHPFAQPGSDDDGDKGEESSDEDLEFRSGTLQVVIMNHSPPVSPLSSRSRATANTSATEESTVQIVRARTQRINTARAHSHSIEEIRQLLSPPPESSKTSDHLRNELAPPAQLTSPSPSPGPPRIPPRSTARRRPNAVDKGFGSLLEHIHEDEPDLSSVVRTTRSVSLPLIAPPSSDSAILSLPPPPRPRNRALVSPASAAIQPRLPSTPTYLHPTPIQTSNTQVPPPPNDLRPVPTLAIPPSRRDSLDHHRWSLYSLPLSPVGIPLPPSTATANFPQSPHSTVFQTIGSPPITPLQSSFLPSCNATSVRSSTIREDWPSPRPSEDLPNRSSNRLSTLSNPFGDFSFLRPLPNNRASGISFASNISGSSARSPTEAESIPIGLHRATSQDADRDEFLLPVTPRSSWLRSAFEVDHLSGRERAKSLNLAYIPIASLNKVDRVLGKGASRALISGVHDHVPHLFSPSSMSSSPENTTPTTAVDPTQQSFLPSTAPPSAFSMSHIGRRLSKRSSPSSERRRSEDVPRPSSQASVGLMARMDRFIGRTPSPAGRTRELESEDEAPSPPPLVAFPKPIQGRNHSSSDPSVEVGSTITGRPSTSNMRTAAERAELVKKTRKIQQMLGDVPPVSGATGSAFYRVSRAARSEDSLVSPTSAVVVIGGPVEHRGHRSSASLSLLPLSPVLQTDGLLNIRTSGSGEDFGLGLNDGGLSPVASVQPEDVDGEGPEHDHEADEAAIARRAKRAKVAKLHRYLGSRVPAHLVLGLDESWDPEQGLPDVRSEDGAGAETGSMFSSKKKRRASDGDCTLLEGDIADLSIMSSEDKARAVRRKAKMEKMFGERPPQKLYQLHQSGTDTPSKSDAEHDSDPEEDRAAEPLDDSEGGEHYQSYRASFNSLAYFVNNADRDSLEGLYDIVSGPSDDPEAQRNHFTARRKRAAKLSNFFGVSYRDLFGAVLDILESDVKEDKEEGSLTPAETQDLLRKLKSLKDKGEKIRG